MKILVIGSGGREDALVWKLAQSPRVQSLYCAPGNPGIMKRAECVAIPSDDVPSLLQFAKEKGIGLTIVGPERPLAGGLVDSFRAAGLAVIGPTRAAARIETSKVFSKEFMKRHKIPTAPFHVFSEPEAAVHHIRGRQAGVVVKADGLAGGKGVTVAQDESDAIQAVEAMMRRKVFGEAGERILIEDRLVGDEATFLVFTDGRTIVPMVSSQDHKRAWDGDRGPNTGGMGAFSPTPLLSPALQEKIVRTVVEPAVSGLAMEGTPFQGILYIGLMLTSEGPVVLEFNARFGDPEAQVVLPRLLTDLAEILEAMAQSRLDGLKIEWDEKAALCVVMASQGYPENPEGGYPIDGLDEAERLDKVVVFHSGTVLRDGHLFTSGGRVVGVTAYGRDLAATREQAYAAVSRIRFKGMHYRRDIGLNALRSSSDRGKG